MEGNLAIFSWYKISFNHLLTKLLEKTQFTEFNATDNRVLELYSYACSSGEQNAAISYIIVYIYVRGLIHGTGREVPNATERHF